MIAHCDTGFVRFVIVFVSFTVAINLIVHHIRDILNGGIKTEYLNGLAKAKLSDGLSTPMQGATLVLPGPGGRKVSESGGGGRPH